ncbi:MAG: hypothetical protein Fues2KO_22090 [Fuerstiella sp.]
MNAEKKQAADAEFCTPLEAIMKLWKKILAGLAVVIVLFLVGGLLLPRTYEVERSIEIEASPQQIYGPVSHLEKWQSWTAWNKENYPGMSYSYDGPKAGIGAKSNWTDPEAGNGQMEIVAADEQTGITYTLDFEGFARTYGDVEFQPTDDPGVTKVTMKMKGDLGGNPLNRYFGLLMDGMIGADFEKSLQGLKQQVESAAAAAPIESAETFADGDPFRNESAQPEATQPETDPNTGAGSTSAPTESTTQDPS